MEIKREEVIKAFDNEGNELKVGTFYVFLSGGRTYCGIFTGIKDKKYLGFVGVAPFEQCEFNVLPKSIEGISCLL